MLNEKTNGMYCTADLWRIGQQSRSAYLGFWLCSLFRKPLPYGLKSKQRAPFSATFACPPPRKPEVAATIAGLPSSQGQKATAAWPAADNFELRTTNREAI
jgi:hypothetical protein